MRVFVGGRPPGRLRLVFAPPPPFLPAKVHGGSRRPKAAASGPDHGDAPSMLFAAFAMNPVRAKSSRPAAVFFALRQVWADAAPLSVFGKHPQPGSWL